MPQTDPGHVRTHPAPPGHAPGEADRQECKGRSPDAPLHEGPHKNARAEEASPAPPFYKRPLVLVIGGVVLAAGIAVAVIWWLHSRHYVQTDDAFIDGHVVHASPQVAGRVMEVLVTDNQDVEAGQLLVRIDPRDLDARVAEAEATVGEAQGKLAQARSQLEVARTAVEQAKADVNVAQANATNAKRELERYRAVQSGAVAQQALENVQTAATTSAAQLQAAQKRQAASEAQVEAAQSAITTAEQSLRSANASLEAAKLQRSYADIRASRPGRITRRSVEPGDFVQLGQDLFAIVTSDIWVTANFKETDLAHMREGMPTRVEVDAFPDLKLQGHVDSFQRGSGAAFSLLPPENATGNYVKIVQRVPVKIVFDEPAEKLRRLGPGMSVVPRVKIR